MPFELLPKGTLLHLVNDSFLDDRMLRKESPAALYPEAFRDSIALQAAVSGACAPPDPSPSVICIRREDEKSLSLLADAFETIFVSENEAGCLRLELHDLRQSAADSFRAFAETGEADPFIRRFTLERTAFAGDSIDLGIYRYVGEKDCSAESRRVSAPYLDFLKTTFRFNCEYGISVSGYALEELSRDPYLRVLAEQFDHLYLMAYPAGSPEAGVHKKIIKLS